MGQNGISFKCNTKKTTRPGNKSKKKIKKKKKETRRKYVTQKEEHGCTKKELQTQSRKN